MQSEKQKEKTQTGKLKKNIKKRRKTVGARKKRNFVFKKYIFLFAVIYGVYLPKRHAKHTRKTWENEGKNTCKKTAKKAQKQPDLLDFV